MPPPDMSLRRSVVLLRRPSGAPDRSHFDILEDAIPSPGPGEVVTRTIWLSIDPYMRGRLREQQTYAKAVEIGEVMTGETVGQVVASADPGFAVGDIAVGARGWQSHVLSKAAQLTKVPRPNGAPSNGDASDGACTGRTAARDANGASADSPFRSIVLLAHWRTRHQGVPVLR